MWLWAWGAGREPRLWEGGETWGGLYSERRFGAQGALVSTLQIWGVHGEMGGLMESQMWDLGAPASRRQCHSWA